MPFTNLIDITKTEKKPKKNQKKKTIKTAKAKIWLDRHHPVSSFLVQKYKISIMLNDPGDGDKLQYGQPFKRVTRL